jgi:pimeloyl-ACP methyl ester carboxylesterase
VKIAYETFGTPSGQPLLLVMGLGAQMLYWPDDFCAALADAGFAVTRFDNRDTGLSTRFSTARVPSLFMMRTRPAAAVIYPLEDMADDATSVLDALESDSAHIIGVSLLAARFVARSTLAVLCTVCRHSRVAMQRTAGPDC